ncbi:MAG TPA: hypothetical protein VHE30_11125 [Polyangiaceae bacterium]|nr:hypothetical protein [Polyangiaceae bacterium]
MFRAHVRGSIVLMPEPEGAEPDSDWCTVPECARIVGGAAPRTIYTWAADGKLPSKEIDGVLHVSRRAATERVQQQHVPQGAAAAAQGSGNGSPPAAPDLEAARSRLALRQVALEEERLVAQAEAERRRRAEEEHALGIERARRLAKLETEAQRERLVLDHERWQRERERHAAESQVAMEQARREGERNRHAAERSEAERRRVWRNRLETDAAEYIRNEIGSAGLVVGLPAVRNVLDCYGPNDPEEAVANALLDELDVVLAELRAQERRRVEVRARQKLVDEAIWAPCLRQGGDVRQQLRLTAEHAAAKLNPFDPRARSIVDEAVRVVLERINRAREQEARADAEAQSARFAAELEEAAAVAEAEREAEAVRAAAETDRAWREVSERDAPEWATRWLPPEATREEREQLVHELRALVEQRPDYLRPIDFHDFAMHAVRETVRALHRRVAAERALERHVRADDPQREQLRAVAERAAQLWVPTHSTWRIDAALTDAIRDRNKRE